MAKTANLNIRVDDEVKIQAERICTELGTSMSNAINMFLCSMVRSNGFPFELRLAGFENDDSIFYSESNMKALKKSIEQSKQGKVIYKTIEELEEMENG